jgi:two-component system, NarL family, sensor histidine kinase UhpB
VDATEQERQAQRNRAGNQTPLRSSSQSTEVEPDGARIAAGTGPSSALPEGAAQLEEIEAFVNLGRWVWDVSTGAITCSPQLIRIYGLTSPDLISSSDSFLLRTHQADRTRARASIMRALSTFEPFQFQQRIVRLDNTMRVLRTRGSVESAGDGKPTRILGISQDVTDLHAADQRAQERLRHVARRTLDREEQDRGRIAKELRERVSEPLISLGKRLAGVNSAGPASEAGPVAAQIEECIHLVNTVVATTLHVIGHLRPSVLEEHGLLAALRAEALRVGRQAAIPVSLSGEEISPRLPIGVETAFFRLAQEGLANAARHAGCTLIRVALSGSNTHARLEIQDNGTGFDATAVTDKESAGTGGLTLMRERAEAVSATFRLSSQPGSGARITVDYRG